MILLDTSAIYALADRGDPNHARAMALFQSALADEDLLVHSYVLVEAAALLQRRLGLEPALDFLREAATFTLHWVSLREHQVAVELLQDRGRRGLSLVDCVSFAVMRHYGVTRAFAFDEDFEREGFALYRGHSA